MHDFISHVNNSTLEKIIFKQEQNAALIDILNLKLDFTRVIVPLLRCIQFQLISIQDMTIESSVSQDIRLYSEYLI